MSYEIKRLPLTFQAPLGKTWAGFLTPGHAHGIACTDCRGTGQSPELYRLQRDFYDSDGFGDRWHYEWDRDEDGREIEGTKRVVGDCRRWSHRITQAEVDHLISKDRLWKGATAEQVNRWDFERIGHDGINQHYLIEHRATRLGIWGYCPKCRGEGVTYRSVAHRRSVEGWKPRALPTGPGYALWHTVSDGMPVSPVFATPKQLAAWLADEFTREGYFAEHQWLKLIDIGFCPSGAVVDGRFLDGLRVTMGEPDRWGLLDRAEPVSHTDDAFPFHLMRGRRYHSHLGWR